MTKNENREASKLHEILTAYKGFPVTDAAAQNVIGYAARGFSAMVRASKTPNEIHVFAAGWPAVIQHPDYIV